MRFTEIGVANPSNHLWLLVYLFGRAQTNVTLGLSLLVSVATLEHSRSNLQVNIDTIIHMDKLSPGRSATTRGVCRILRF